MTQKTTRRGFTQNEKLSSVPLAGKVREAGKGGVKRSPFSITPSSVLPGTFPLMGKEKHHGFTLIELLVVVLIIGLLAAVAVPQYNKAVRKAHGAEALTALDALDKAVAAYYLENGSYEGLPDGLNLEIPALSHFRYNVGTAGYTTGVRSIHEQVGSWNSPLSSSKDGASLMISIVSPENISVRTDWEKGKLKSRICGRVGNANSSSVSCAQYFNCNASPVQWNEPTHPQLGCTGYYTGGECTL